MFQSTNEPYLESLLQKKQALDTLRQQRAAKVVPEVTPVYSDADRIISQSEEIRKLKQRLECQYINKVRLRQVREKEVEGEKGRVCGYEG